MSARNKASIWTARFIPGFLALLVVYASWIIVGPLSINYLINPPTSEIPRQVALGIAFPIIYFFLLLPVAACWLRLLLVVLRDPGYIPQGSGSERRSEHEPKQGLENFWMRDVFVCDSNGHPIWCSHCNAWKPDRTHHSQDVGRCTRKMDHFCPWVGGVVGERAMKFFIQFLFYSMILTCYTTTLLAYFVARYKGDVQLFVGLGISGFFLLFTVGMVMNSLNLVFKNTTTIENVSRRLYLAVLLPPEMQEGQVTPLPSAKLSRKSDFESEIPLTSDLDDAAHASYFNRPRRLANRATPSKPHSPAVSKIWRNTITYPLHLPVDRPPIPAPIPRKFAVLRCPPGLNPWNLGSAYRNFTAVFGTKLHDWVLPFKHSPCCDHGSVISEFPLGPEFEVLLEDAGLVHIENHAGDLDQSNSSQTRKRRRRLDAGWQNGERPDGWMSKKEAMRIRNEWQRRANQGRDQDQEVG